MLKERLKDYTIILASGSPRRHQFLKEMGLEFQVRLKPIEEIYPEELQAAAISDYLAELKAAPFLDILFKNDIVITSDTVVWHKGESLAKAANDEQAFEMLQKLSGTWHEVITSVCFTTYQEQKTLHSITKVKLKELSNEEIVFYIKNYRPFDKAGAYGIQEWIGLIAIEEIQGSYSNVVGLPTHLVYKTLMDMVD